MPSMKVMEMLRFASSLESGAGISTRTTSAMSRSATRVVPEDSHPLPSFGRLVLVMRLMSIPSTRGCRLPRLFTLTTRHCSNCDAVTMLCCVARITRPPGGPRMPAGPAPLAVSPSRPRAESAVAALARASPPPLRLLPLSARSAAMGSAPGLPGTAAAVAGSSAKGRRARCRTVTDAAARAETGVEGSSTLSAMRRRALSASVSLSMNTSECGWMPARASAVWSTSATVADGEDGATVTGRGGAREALERRRSGFRPPTASVASDANATGIRTRRSPLGRAPAPASWLAAHRAMAPSSTSRQYSLPEPTPWEEAKCSIRRSLSSAGKSRSGIPPSSCMRSV
mmetsp:Transcript_16419/g.62270  ORF Transcript_16419/g.62270 Transcript_16419/m.62270 type:complete len:342 (+) Transcript_16419:201-1226(+)